ncbi:uncharacterized protein [Henckelia pumila]|uniref:uncharacterized protein isoform X2 n=1 Tax=Henckelia pumila TaxID=405737 RepID=UPI003C6DDD67
MLSISLLLLDLKFVRIYLTPNWSMIEQSYQTGKEEDCMMQDCMALISKKTRYKGFSDFLQEMVSLINDARKEEKTYSTKDLQSMFWDMARGFGIPEYDTPKPTHESQWLHAKMNDTATANKRMRRAQHTQNLNSPAYADCKSRSVY